MKYQVTYTKQKKNKTSKQVATFYNWKTLPYGRNISFLLVFLILRLSLYSQSNSPYEGCGANFFLNIRSHKVAITFLSPYCMI